MKPKYFYGYNIVAAGFLVQAVTVGAMFTYGVFFKEFEAAFGWSRALVSGASSLAFLVMGVVGVAAGRLNDTIGPRLLIAASGAALGVGYLLMSVISAPWHLYLLYGGLVGIGFSTHDVICLSTIARWFIRRRGMMTGMVKVGTGAGQFVVPLIAAALITALGWRSAYLVIGGSSLVALLAVAQLMKRDPQVLGLLPDGDRQEDPRRPHRPEVPSLTFAAAARTLSFWTLCFAEFTIFFCLLTTIVHIVPHASDQGLEKAVAAAVLSTIGAVSMAGRIVMGTANDRIGGKRSLVFCFILLIASFLWLQAADRAWMLFVFAVVYGFAHGGFFTVMSPTVAELFGTQSHGLLFGIVFFTGTLGGSIGPFLTGALFDATGSYHLAFGVLTALAATGLALVLSMRPHRQAG